MDGYSGITLRNLKIINLLKQCKNQLESELVFCIVKYDEHLNKTELTD